MYVIIEILFKRMGWQCKMYLQLELVVMHIQFGFVFFHVIWLFDRAKLKEKNKLPYKFVTKMHLCLVNVIISCYPRSITEFKST